MTIEYGINKAHPSDNSARDKIIQEREKNEETEEMVRFCPECGHIGEVSANFHDCCPEGSSARVVPKQFAEICQRTFKDLLKRSNLNRNNVMLGVDQAFKKWKDDPFYYEWNTPEQQAELNFRSGWLSAKLDEIEKMGQHSK